MLFPAAIIAVIVLGMVTVLYARESRPDPGSFPPQVGDHWHAAYGFYVCDTWLPKFQDDKEEQVVDPQTGQEQFVDEDFSLTGIHSHGDGVIHYHPYSTRSVGRRAKVGVFLDVYDVELTTTRLAIPEGEGGNVYDLDEGFRCNGEDTEIKVVAWDNYTDTGNGQTYITDLSDVAIRNDGMVFAIAVVPTGTEVSMPSWAADLPALGAVDSGNVPVTTVEGQPAATGDPVTPASDTATTVVGDTATTIASDTVTTVGDTSATANTGSAPAGTGESGSTPATDG
jgi:hypothetical protein